MTLAPGTRLGPYEIVGPLGAGGMGEVYRAKDTRLGRDVAIKALPEGFERDPERAARFEREAKLLAALQHPNVGSIFGLEEVGGHRYLVLEFVEGETLSARLSRGALPVDEALAVCAQIAAAVEAAHEAGVIHRDLKPGNVMLKPDGIVKVLDFGLAKASATDGSSADMGLPASPTMTYAATGAGVILGTAGYMSPEQARGKAVDRRTDIWSFGCVLFECITGRQAFAGETVSDVIARILQTEPDWSALPAATPLRVRDLLARCLTRDAKQRLQAIGEARIVLELVAAQPADASPAAAPASAGRPRPRRLAAVLPWVVAALALGVAAVALSRRPALRPSASEVSVVLPQGRRLGEDVGFHFFALSPDGRALAYASHENGRLAMRLRRLDHREDVELPGTENARDMFFSPDGEWIAFFDSQNLLKASVHGGAPVVLAPAGQDRLGTWLADGTIVFSAETTAPLTRMPAAGGTPVAITQLDTTAKERTHRFPCALAGGPWVVFTVGRVDSPGGYDNGQIDAVNVRTGERRWLVHGARRAIWAPPGYLVYDRAGDLYAMPIDPRDPRPTSEPIPVLDGVAGETSSGAAFMDISSDGTLAWIADDERAHQRTIGWFDRSGRWTPTAIPPGEYRRLALSPEGRRALIDVGPGGGSSDLWVADLASGGMNRITFGGTGSDGVWLKDGARMAYARRDSTGGYSVVVRRIDGDGGERDLFHVSHPIRLTDCTPSGDRLIFSDYGLAQGRIWTVHVDGDPDPHALAPDRGNDKNEMAAAVSPDGRWIAYVSNRTSREEVCVRRFEGEGGSWQVSAGGGRGLRWGHDGRELFLVQGETLKRVTVDDAGPRSNGGPVLSVSQPTPLFEVPPSPTEPAYRDYAYDPRGDRFLFTRPLAGTEERREIVLSLGWTLHLAERIRARKARP